MDWNPSNKLLQSERKKLNLETELHQKSGRSRRSDFAVADAIRRNRAGLNDEKNQSEVSFSLEPLVLEKQIAKSFGRILFDDENNMTRIDMSEYQERHSVSRLVGAPPGYVGYDEGGQLTEAVRRRPYSVVLLTK